MQDIDKEIAKLKEMLKQYEQAYIKCMGAIEFLEKKKSEESKKMLSRGIKQLGDFGFADGEIDNIFDLIEKEHPDL